MASSIVGVGTASDCPLKGSSPSCWLRLDRIVNLAGGGAEDFAETILDLDGTAVDAITGKAVAAWMAGAARAGATGVPAAFCKATIFLHALLPRTITTIRAVPNIRSLTET